MSAGSVSLDPTDRAKLLEAFLDSPAIASPDRILLLGLRSTRRSQSPLTQLSSFKAGRYSAVSSQSPDLETSSKGSLRRYCPMSMPSPRVDSGCRNPLSIRCRVGAPNVSHTQATSTSQPAFLKALRTLEARSTLVANWDSQYSCRVVGVVVREQASYRCQKQPWTNMTFRSLGNTRSGLPGKSFLWRRSRNPIACTRLLTAISGFVPLDLTRPISADLAGSTPSPHDGAPLFICRPTVTVQNFARGYR